MARLKKIAQNWTSATPLARFYAGSLATVLSTGLSLLVAIPCARHLTKNPTAEQIALQIRQAALPDCRPEAAEQLSYVIFLLLLPGCLFLFASHYSEAFADQKRLEHHWWRASKALALIFVVSGLQQSEWFRLFPDFALIAAAFGLGVLAVRRLQLERFRPILFRFAPSPFASNFIAGAIIAIALAHSIFTASSLSAAGKSVQHHLSYFIDEFAAPFAGRTVLVNFFPQYVRLLPHLAEPFFSVFGFGMTSFTILMAMLNATWLFVAWRLIVSVIGNSTRALVGFACFTGLAVYRVGDNPYLSSVSYSAIGPFRVLLPMLALGAFSCWLRKPNTHWKWTTLVLASTAAVNNLDFGAPTWLALTLALAWTERSWFRIPMQAGAALAISVFTFSAFIFHRSGAWPDWSAALEFQKIFARDGFYMLPLRVVGVYYWIFGVFIAALFLGSIRSWINWNTSESARYRQGLLLAAGLMGLGCSPYFIGRSHLHVLPSLFWIFGICLILLFEEYRGLLRLPGLLPRRATTPPAFFFSLFALAGVSGLPFPKEVLQKIHEWRSREGALELKIHSLALELKALAQGGHAILTMPYGHWVAIEAQSTNVSPFVQDGSIILRSQLDELLETAQRECAMTMAFETPAQDLISSLRARGFSEVKEIEKTQFWKLTNPWPHCARSE